MEYFLLVAEETQGQTPHIQFEFRIWPPGWPGAASQVQRSWRPEGAERRSDIYLLTSHSPVRLVKLRAGTRLETKRRGPDCEPLQSWTRRPYPTFPLSRLALRDLADELGTELLPPDAGLSPAHLVAELGASAPAVLPITVRKSRLLFSKGNCRAEICRVAVSGRPRLTLAIEGPDPNVALRSIEALRIGHLRNRSCGEMLCHRMLPAAQETTAPHQ